MFSSKSYGILAIDLMDYSKTGGDIIQWMTFIVFSLFFSFGLTYIAFRLFRKFNRKTEVFR